MPQSTGEEVKARPLNLEEERTEPWRGFFGRNTPVVGGAQRCLERNVKNRAPPPYLRGETTSSAQTQRIKVRAALGKMATKPAGTGLVRAARHRLVRGAGHCSRLRATPSRSYRVSWTYL